MDLLCYRISRLNEGANLPVGARNAINKYTHKKKRQHHAEAHAGDPPYLPQTAIRQLSQSQHSRKRQSEKPRQPDYCFRIQFEASLWQEQKDKAGRKQVQGFNNWSETVNTWRNDTIRFSQATGLANLRNQSKHASRVPCACARPHEKCAKIKQTPKHHAKHTRTEKARSDSARGHKTAPLCALTRRKKPVKSKTTPSPKVDTSITRLPRNAFGMGVFVSMAVAAMPTAATATQTAKSSNHRGVPS